MLQSEVEAMVALAKLQGRYEDLCQEVGLQGIASEARLVQHILECRPCQRRAAGWQST